jgi:phosphatidylinositol 3-kinase
MNVIRMMDIVLRDAGLPLNILTYRVLPTSRNSGFIEIVPHAHTVYDIEIKLKSTLQKFILDRNRSDTVGDIFDRFSSSMAAYSLVCYILALGDRHKNNIMVREDGTLFHIDYGYILGKDASLKSTIAPYMRITQEMKDAMGGEDSPEYKKFQERCVKGFSILRKWTSVFCNMMMPLVNSSPPILGENFEQLKSIIQDRFRPDSLPSEATNALTAAIQKSNEHTGGKAIDTLHRIAKAGGAAMAPFTDGITGGNITKSISKWWPWSGKK